MLLLEYNNDQFAGLALQKAILLYDKILQGSYEWADSLIVKEFPDFHNLANNNRDHLDKVQEFIDGKLPGIEAGVRMLMLHAKSLNKGLIIPESVLVKHPWLTPLVDSITEERRVFIVLAMKAKQLNTNVFKDLLPLVKSYLWFDPDDALF